MIGVVLNDRYEMRNELGRGGMGVVYRAYDSLLRREVAVKIASGANLNDYGGDQLLREARIIAMLDHPNIVSILDAGETVIVGEPGQVTYIVMPLVDGALLSSYVPGSLDEGLNISLQISAALQEIHWHGLLHCDLKPENVLITTGGRVNLLDFGLARRYDPFQPDRDGLFTGTLVYLAPELILGQAASPQSDLYALGVMLFEIFTGVTPFECDNETTLLFQHLYAPVTPPSAYNEAIPPALEQLIMALVNKQPGDRPVSAGRVHQALQSLQNGELVLTFSSYPFVN
jgi:serine/threonine-protein kinase